MKTEISKHILGTKGLTDKEIKSYYKNLKDVRQIISPGGLGPDPTESFYELNGGYRFFYQEWNPNPKKHESPPTAIVFAFHAAYGCSDIFYPLADKLTKSNILVVGYDFRGHGRTAGFAGGKLGDLEKIVDIYSDIEKLLYSYTKKYDLPIYLLGYDLGGIIALNVAKTTKNKNIAGIILISPIIKLQKKLKHILLYPLVSIGNLITKNETTQKIFSEKIMPTYFEEYRNFAENDPFRLKKMSLRMFKKILDLINLAPLSISKLNYPCIIFQGTADHLVDHAAIEKTFQKWPHPSKLIRLYQNGGHNLLMDKFTLEVYDHIDKFILH